MAALMIGLLFIGTACDSVLDDEDHEDAARVEIQTRGDASAIIAVWEDGIGWQDADGSAIDEFPNSVDVDGADIEPLRAGGQNASLTVRFFNPDGSEVEMETLDRTDDTRERTCSEFNVRYRAVDDDGGLLEDTDAIAWPNIIHPDGGDQAQFAELADGSIVGIFHCDHIHFYPENEGTVDVQFRLWHVDHSDDDTDPIMLRVEPAE